MAVVLNLILNLSWYGLLALGPSGTTGGPSFIIDYIKEPTYNAYMSCYNSAIRAQWLADLERLNAQLENLYVAFNDALKNAEVAKYSFNSNEGSQSTERRSISEIQDVIDTLEAKRDLTLRKLNRKGLVNMNLRRKNYRFGRY